MAARQHGAKAMLVVTGPHSPNAGELAPMTFDTAIAGSGILAAQRHGKVGDALCSRPGRARRCRTRRSRSTPATRTWRASRFPASTVSVHAAVVRETRTGRNIAAICPPRRPRRQVPKPWVALGAHYDHLGSGDNGLSLASKEEAGRVHGGADDNASGTAAVLAVADTFVEGAAPPEPRLQLLVGRGTRVCSARRRSRRSRRFRSPTSRPISTSTWSAACRTTSSTSRPADRARCGTS